MRKRVIILMLFLLTFLNGCTLYRDEMANRQIILKAAETRNLSLCDTLLKPGSFNYRPNSFYYTDSSPWLDCKTVVAIATKNVSICDDIKFYLCYFTLAKELDDVELCDKITEYHSYRSLCFSYFAEKNKDPTICKRVGKNVFGEDISYFCYTNVAIAKEDPSICENLKLLKEKEFCYSQLADAEKGTAPSHLS